MKVKLDKRKLESGSVSNNTPKKRRKSKKSKTDLRSKVLIKSQLNRLSQENQEFKQSIRECCQMNVTLRQTILGLVSMTRDLVTVLGNLTKEVRQIQTQMITNTSHVSN